MLKVGSKIKFVSLAKIRYIRARGDYILVNTVDEVFTVRERIKNIEGSSMTAASCASTAR